MAALKPCASPGCPELTRSTRCPEHAAKRLALDVQERGSSTDRGYDSVWRQLRDRYYQLHPDCEACAAGGLATPGQIVDHVTPHRGDDVLRLDVRNLQTLCLSCHRRKTMTEGAGYVARGVR